MLSGDIPYRVSFVPAITQIACYGHRYELNKCVRNKLSAMIAIACWFTLVYLNVVLCDSDRPCPIELSVDISDGVFKQDELTYEKDGKTYTHYFSIGDSVRGCICKTEVCVRKCCDYEENLDPISKNCTYNSELPDFLISLPAEPSIISSFYVINGMLDCGVRKRTVLQSGSDYFSVNAEGFVVYKSAIFKHEDYCLDYIFSKDLSAVICKSDEHNTKAAFCTGIFFN